MSYETQARRANGAAMTSRLEETYEDRYQTASAAIADEIKDNFDKCPDDLAHLLARIQQIALEQADGTLLDEFPWLKLDFHLGKHYLRPVQAQLAYAARDMEPDEFFINCEVEESEC